MPSNDSRLLAAGCVLQTASASSSVVRTVSTSPSLLLLSPADNQSLQNPLLPSPASPLSAPKRSPPILSPDNLRSLALSLPLVIPSHPRGFPDVTSLFSLLFSLIYFVCRYCFYYSYSYLYSYYNSALSTLVVPSLNRLIYARDIIVTRGQHSSV